MSGLSRREHPVRSWTSLLGRIRRPRNRMPRRSRLDDRASRSPARLSSAEEAALLGLLFYGALGWIALQALTTGFQPSGHRVSSVLARQSLLLSLGAAVSIVAFLSAVTVFSGIRRDSERRGPRWVHIIGPYSLALTILTFSGVLLLTVGPTGESPPPLVIALVLFNAYAWPVLVAWAVVGVGLLRRRPDSFRALARKSVPRASRPRRNPLRSLPAAAVGSVVIAWVVMTLPHSPQIQIDGNMGDWSRIPAFLDKENDAFVVSFDSTFVYRYRLPAEYEVLLNITDSGGASNETRLLLSVPNLRPTPQFSISTQGFNVSFDASRSFDFDDAIVDYSWSLGDGRRGTGVLVDHTFEASSTYNVTLTVTDSRGARSSTTRPVTVQGPNRPPFPSFTVVVGNFTVVASAAGSYDRDGEITGYDWEFGDGTSTTGPVATHMYVSKGTYNIVLRVVDDEGASASIARTVTVPNGAPTASIAIDIDALTVWCSAINLTDDGRIVEILWAFGDGSRASGSTARHQYARAGTYLVTLTLRDDLGYTSTILSAVTVSAASEPGQPPAPHPPVARFSVYRSGLYVTLDAGESYDPDGTILEYLWTFGDGGSSDGQNVSHLFARAEAYAIGLTLTDNEGLRSQASVTVDLRDVVQSTLPPVPRIIVVIDDFNVTFDASRSTASAEPVVRFRWTLVRPDPGLDLLKVKVAREGSMIYLYAEVAGPMFRVLGAGRSVTFYFQTHPEAVGQAIAGVSSEYFLRLAENGGAVRSGQLFWYSAAGSPRLQREWRAVATIDVAVADSALESRLPVSALLSSQDTILRLTCAIEFNGLAADVLDSSLEF